MIINSTKEMKALNLELLFPKREDLLRIGVVRSISIFDATSRNFHSQGLFSTEIFGKVGDPIRNTKPGYIPIFTKVLHPAMFRALIKLKSFYLDLMMGRKFAVWDNEQKDFVKTTPAEGKTGLSFFLSKLEQIVFKETGSDSRKGRIDLVVKYLHTNGSTSMIENLLVLPAGLRDYSVDDDGKPTEDDINKFYRKVLINANLLETARDLDEEYSDGIRFALQKTILDIYEYLETNSLDGKYKMILGKWTTRKIATTTRNVFSTNIEESSSADSPQRLGYNQVGIGLAQALRTTQPKSTYEIRNRYLRMVFPSDSDTRAILTNAETLEKEEVYVSDIAKEYETWTSPEGMTDLIVKFSESDIPDTPIEFNNGKHYMGLLYRVGNHVRFCQGLSELGPDVDPSKVKPIHYSEFLYMCISDMHNEIPIYVTRYPITGYGSIYPAMMHIKTTLPATVCYEVDESNQPNGRVFPNFPVRGKPFFNTMVVHPSHLARLGADFDGDMGDCSAVLSDEAIEEVKRLHSSSSYYKDPRGQLAFSTSHDILDQILGYLTGHSRS